MRFVIQRVSAASVTVEEDVVGAIDRGLLVLVGVGHGDTRDILDKMVDKTLGLRIFEDAAGKMNLSLADLHSSAPGSVGILAVSQFTLYADCRKGRRPSFTDSAPPEMARATMADVVARFAESGIRTEQGIFGAHMLVSLMNDGPVTIILDSSELFPGTG